MGKQQRTTTPVPRLRTPDGTTVRLDSLPLVAYSLNCSHLGRDYGILKGDLVFCNDCGTTKKVANILAE